jgi:phosphopantothenate-cysteine ligase/phosphopantothenoylcysteine decarboxylase/phosphopantothenate--cysteine ligase
MNILVTAGNTQTPIDQVRCITNVFTGRTGAQIALEAHRRGHDVTILTSHPEVLRRDTPPERWSTRSYRTFDDLRSLMAELVPGGRFDVFIHAAAVSDFHVDGVFAERAGQPIDVSIGKLSSRLPELWLRLTPTPKLADKVRTDWDFHGVFVKFKLEVGVTNEKLREIAAQSRAQSDADLIVANTFEERDVEAFISDRSGGWLRVPRVELAGQLLDLVEINSASAGPG